MKAVFTFTFLATLIFLISQSQAQGVIQQFGSLIAGDAIMSQGNNRGVDAGNSSVPTIPGTRLTSLGVVNSGFGYCQWNPDPGANTIFSTLCLGFKNGNGLILYNSPTNNPLDLSINGTIYPFPFVLSGVVGPGSTTVGDCATWNNTSGTLLADKPCPGTPVNIVTNFGAKCDGTTNDSAAFTTAFATSGPFILPSGVTCVVSNLVLSAGKILNCSGSTLEAATGANWVISLSGFATATESCNVDDANSNTMTSSTLASSISPGSLTAVVNGGSYQRGQILTVFLDNGWKQTTKIAGISGTTLTMLDPLPASVPNTAPTVASAGNGCHVGETLTTNAGYGHPATFEVLTLTGADGSGVATVSAPLVPGMFTTYPSNPVMMWNGGTCLGVTLNLPSAIGASSGNATQAAFGLVLFRAGLYDLVDRSYFQHCPVCIQEEVVNSSTDSIAFATVSNFEIGASMVGLARGVNVNNTRALNGIIYGHVTGGSGYAGAGIYADSQNVTAFPSGGNIYTNVQILNNETGVLLRQAQLDTFLNTQTDGTRGWGWRCDGCANEEFNGTVRATYSGPSEMLGIPSQGIGFSFTSYRGFVPMGTSFADAYVANNATDFYFADSANACGSPPCPLDAIVMSNYGPGQVMGGFTEGILPNRTIFAAQTGNTLTPGPGTPIYMGSGLGYGSGNLTGVAIYNSLRGNITKFACAGGVLQTGGNATCAVQRSASTIASCTILSGTFGCTSDGPGIAVFDGDELNHELTGADSNAWRTYAAGG